MNHMVYFLKIRNKTERIETGKFNEMNIPLEEIHKTPIMFVKRSNSENYIVVKVMALVFYLHIK